MKTVLVIAGNRREFNFFIAEICDKAKHFTVYNSKAIVDDTRFINVYDERDIRGIRDADFMLYGTWCDRKDLPVLREVMIANLMSQNKEIPNWIREL